MLKSYRMNNRQFFPNHSDQAYSDISIYLFHKKVITLVLYTIRYIIRKSFNLKIWIKVKINSILFVLEITITYNI